MKTRKEENKLYKHSPRCSRVFWEADTFSLLLQYHQEKPALLQSLNQGNDDEEKLIILLYNYAHAEVFQRKFTKKDIGKSVNQKFDLVDIYEAFQPGNCFPQ